MNKRNPAGTVLIVLVAAAILIGMSYLLYSKIVFLENIDAMILTEKSNLEKDARTLQQLEKLSSQDETIKNYIAACTAKIPGKPEESALIDYIQGISGEAMSDLIQIQFEPRVQGEKYFTMPLKITIEGKYEDMLAFLGKIRNGARAIRVDGINAALSDRGDGTIRTEIACKAFYLGR